MPNWKERQKEFNMSLEVSKEALIEKVILDNRPVSLMELEEAQKRKDQRVIKVSEGVFKTLKRLQE